MATYRVQIDGSTYRVESPQELTDAQAYQFAAGQHQEAAQRRAEATAADQQQMRERFAQDEASRPLHERILANVGAGMHNVYQGVAGIPRLFGADIGPTAEEVAEHKAMKANLAEAMPGGKLVQIAGEIAPTFAVPSGAIGAGMRIAGRALPKTLAARAGDIALTGGLVSGATTAGDWGERLVNAGLGAASGAALPVASAGIRGGVRMARPTAAGRAAGRGAGVAERMVRDIGEEGTQELIGKLESAPLAEFQRAGVARPTAAQLTRDPTLQQLELGLRVERPELFKAIDEAAATGRWGELAKIAQDEEALAAAMKAREEATDVMRAAALEAASTVKGFEAPVARAVESILSGPSRTIPQARTLANWVQKELAEGVSPAQLYSMRKALTSGIPHGTELGSAMSQARRERVALVAAIDEALDAASGGQWSPYLRAYQELSAPVTSMKAGQAIQKAFEATSNRTAEGLPVITSHRLHKALAQHGRKQFGSKTVERITPEERATIEAIARSIEAENAARAAQGTIGSGTAGNLAAARRASQIARGAARAASESVVPGGSIAVDVIGPAIAGRTQRAREQATAELLADHELLRAALIAAAKTGRIDRRVAEAARGARAAPGAFDPLE